MTLIPQLATITDTLGPRLARNGLEFRLESRHYPHIYHTHHLLSSSNHLRSLYCRVKSRYVMFTCPSVTTLSTQGKTKGRYKVVFLSIRPRCRSQCHTRPSNPRMGSCFLVSRTPICFSLRVKTTFDLHILCAPSHQSSFVIHLFQKAVTHTSPL